MLDLLLYFPYFPPPSSSRHNYELTICLLYVSICSARARTIPVCWALCSQSLHSAGPGISQVMLKNCQMYKLTHSLKVGTSSYLDMSAPRTGSGAQMDPPRVTVGAVCLQPPFGEALTRWTFRTVKGRLWGQQIGSRDMSKKWGYCVLSQCLSIVLLKLLLGVDFVMP